jgi:hypothetical protein
MYSNLITFSCLSYGGASTAHGTISPNTPVPLNANAGNQETTNTIISSN